MDKEVKADHVGKLEVTSGIAGHTTEVRLDGEPVKNARRLDVHFSVNEVVTATFEIIPKMTYITADAVVKYRYFSPITGEELFPTEEEEDEPETGK